MKLLLVNGNRTEAVTEKVLAEARLVASPGTRLATATARFGADIVFSHAENAIAAHAVLDAIARATPDFDAIVLAISFDSGIDAARELVDVPVLGITESALLAACNQVDRVGVVTFGAVSRSLYGQVFARTGLDTRIAAVRTIEVASALAYLSPQAQDEHVAAEARKLVEIDAAQAVVVCGAAVAGIARRLGDALPVPIVDGVGCAVRLAEAKVRAGERGRSMPPGPRARMEGLAPELAALFERRRRA